MTQEEEIKIKGYLLSFANDFCLDNGIDPKKQIPNLPPSIEKEEWYDKDIFINLINNIIKQKKSLSYVEKLGKNFFHYLNDKYNIFDETVEMKNAISKIYNAYQMFISGKRIGMWKTTEFSVSGFMRVKENTVIPAYFTKGFLFSMAEKMDCIAVSVKLIKEIDESEEGLNEYEISWMNRLTK